MRLLIHALLALALLAPASAAAGSRKAEKVKAAYANTVTIRDAVTVNSRLVRLGDLFTVEGEKADIAVAYAPVAGKRAVFDARWLYRVARAYGLRWTPVGLQDQVVVERESQAISREEIEDHLRAALIDRGADPDTTVELSNRLMRLHVPGDAAATIAVEEASYEPRTGRFTAIIAAPADSPAATRTRVTGRIHRIVEVPVPTRRVLAKEVIDKNDVKWIKVRRDRLPRGIITDMDQLAGMAAKRGLRAGQPVAMSSVQRPVLVPKNSLVTIVLRVPRMTLTAQGKAMEDGSDGDTIRITNLQSKKVIEAEVTGTATVQVLPNTMTAMN